MRNITTTSFIEDRNELLRLRRINSVVYHDVSVKSRLSRYFWAFPVVFMSVVLPRSCSSGLKGSFCLLFLMSCQTCMTSVQLNSIHIYWLLCVVHYVHTMEANGLQCCLVPNVLQKILMFHWRNKVIHVWKDTRASKWRQNDDYFLLNYHSQSSQRFKFNLLYFWCCFCLTLISWFLVFRPCLFITSVIFWSCSRKPVFVKSKVLHWHTSEVFLNVVLSFVRS